MTHRSGIMVAVGFTIASAQASEIPHFDIISILGQFVIAETAARVCTSSDQAETLKFARNRRVIATAAASALRNRNPGLSHEELVVHETQFVKSLAGQTAALVAESGCSSPQVQRLLELYRLQAKMDFRAAMQ